VPHVIVKLSPGKSEEKKQQLADRISQDVMEILGYGLEAVSVALEEISLSEWPERVYRTDIEKPTGKLYKKPGYKM
jgi:4-oxalocrotonate tautomerase